MKIAIVGAGISGSSVLQTLLTDPLTQDQEKQIDIYDHHGNFAQGNPYIPDSNALLMNSEANDLGLDAQHPQDFVEWLENHDNEDQMVDGLVYRHIYGEYLEDYFQDSYEHSQVKSITAEVTDIRIMDDGTCQIATFHDGWIDQLYDVVFLALGHAPYRNSYALKGTDDYIHDPYPFHEKMPDFDSTDRVGIIGSGATGLDIMRYLLEKEDFDEPITFYVRESLFNATGIPCDEEITTSLTWEWIEENMHSQTETLMLDTVLEQVEKDFEHYGIDWHSLVANYGHSRLSDNIRAYFAKPEELAKAQRYFVSIILIFPHLFQALSIPDQQRFLDDYFPYMTIMRASVPYSTMGLVLDALKNNRLRIVNHVSSIEANQSGTFDIYNDDNYIETADILINATGFEDDILKASEQSHLLKNLVKREMILPHDSGKGPLVAWPSAELMTREDIEQPIVMLGNIIHSTHLGNNNARLIASQGRIAARCFIEKYFGVNEE